MTPREAITQANEIYEELTGPITDVEEIPTQAEMVKAIIEVARYLMEYQR